METEKTEILSASDDFITGNVQIKMRHCVILSDGRVLEDNNKPTHIYINFSEVLKTPLTTPDPMEETRVISRTKDEEGNVIEETEKYIPDKQEDRPTKYNQRLSLLNQYLDTGSDLFVRIKSSWDRLMQNHENI